MALGDYIYRLKAQSGDTTPHDELAVSGDLSGGTISLVNLGGGEYAWQFAGAPSTVTTPTGTVAFQQDGGGVTLAARMLVTDYGTGSFDNLVDWDNDLIIQKNGSGSARGRWRTVAGTPAKSLGAGFRTIVLRMTTSPTNAYAQWWLDAVSRASTDPDGIGSAVATYVSASLNVLTIGTDDETIQITDLVLWDEELSNEQCAQIADDGIRAVLDSSPSASISLIPDPVSVTVGGTAELTIMRSTAAPAGGGVTYNLTSSTPASATVPATVNMAEGQTTATFDVTGVSVGDATITAVNDYDEIETASVYVLVSTQRKLRVLVEAAAAGVTDVAGAVWEAPTGGAIKGAEFGEFSGASFSETLVEGKAELKVPVTEFGGDELTTEDVPAVYLRSATHTTGITQVDVSIIEE